MVKRFLQDKAKEVAKGYLREKIQELDVANLILEKFDEELERAIAKQVRQVLIELLGRLDDETILKLARRAREGALQKLEKEEELEQLVGKITRPLLEKLKGDSAMREKLNTTVREIILKALDRV